MQEVNAEAYEAAYKRFYARVARANVNEREAISRAKADAKTAHDYAVATLTRDLKAITETEN